LGWVLARGRIVALSDLYWRAWRIQGTGAGWARESIQRGVCRRRVARLV